MWSIFGWSPHFPVIFLLLIDTRYLITFQRPLANIGPIASFSCHIPLTSDKILLSFLTNDKVIWTNVTDLMSILVQSAWADFSIMMECTPKSGHCHSVCTQLHEPLRKGVHCVLYSIYCTLWTVQCVQYILSSHVWLWMNDGLKISSIWKISYLNGRRRTQSIEQVFSNNLLDSRPKGTLWSVLKHRPVATMLEGTVQLVFGP